MRGGVGPVNGKQSRNDRRTVEGAYSLAGIIEETVSEQSVDHGESVDHGGRGECNYHLRREVGGKDGRGDSLSAKISSFHSVSVHFQFGHVCPKPFMVGL